MLSRSFFVVVLAIATPVLADTLPPPHPPAPPVSSCELPTPGYADRESPSAQIDRIERLFNDGAAALADVRREAVGWRSGRCYHSDSDRADGALLVGEAGEDGLVRSAVAILLAGEPRGLD